MLRNLCCLLVCTLLTTLSVHGQIWVENFDALPNGTQQDPGGTWTTTANDCDDGGGFPGTVFGNYWGVFNGAFFVNDVEGFNCMGTGGDGQNVFLTEIIDISAYACVRITVDLDANGDLECDFPSGPSDDPAGSYNSHDQMVAEYSINGGPWTVFPFDGYICGGIPSNSPSLPVTAQADNLTGNNLQVRIKAGNKANSEEYTFDNIMVTDVSTTPALPALGPYCASDGPVTLNPTQSGISGNWSGPGVSGNVFTPADAGTGTHVLTFTPAPGQCANPNTTNVTVNGAVANPPTQSIDLCFTFAPPNLISENISDVENEITGGTPGLTVNWYSDAAGNNSITPANIFTLLPPPSTVYATVTDGACESTTVPVSVNYNNPPNAINQQDNTCDNGDGTGTFDLTTLNSSVAGGGAPVLWYEDAALTMPINNPGSYTTAPTTVYAEVQGNNDCNSQPASVTLVVDPLPDSNNTSITVTPASSCGPTGVISLQFNLPGGTYDAVIEYGNPTDGFQTFNANSVQANSTIQFGSVNTTTEFRLVSLSNDNGCTVNFAPPITAVVTVTQVDDLPPISDVTVCGSYTLPTDAGSVPIDNYFTAPGGSGTSYVPGQAITQTTTLYAVTGVIPTCFDEESFQVTITSPPDLQPAGTPSVCSGASIDLSTLVIDANGSGHPITFHSASPPTTGNQLPSSLVSPTSTTTYYALADGGANCQDELAITVTVTPTPNANNAGPLQECSDTGTATFDLTSLDNAVNGGGAQPVNWYQDAGLTNSVPNPAAFNSGASTVYATVISNGCESAPIAVQLNVLPNPAFNTPLPPASQCADPATGTATFDLTAFNVQVNNQPGTTVTWYSDAGGANPIAGPGSYAISAGTTVYAFVNNGACTAGPAALPLQILLPPVANAPNIPDLCETANGVATVNLTAYDTQVNGGTGDAVTWYFDNAASNPIPDPANFTTGSVTVYVTVDNGSCTSDALTVPINVLAAPVATDASLQACASANGQATFDLTSVVSNVNNGTGLPVDWFLDPNVNDPINNPNSFSAPNNTTVYAIVDNGVCQSAPALVQLQVIPAPTANPAALSACEEGNGTATFDLTQLEPAVNGGTGLPVNWYLDANGNTPIGSPGSFDTPTLTVYATVSNGLCTSPPVAVDLTVDPAPVANATALTACADNNGQAAFDLTQANTTVNGGTGLTVNWYADPAGNNPVASPGSFLTGSTTVYATVSNAACESGTVPVTLTVAPGPQLSDIEVLNSILCTGDNNGSLAAVVTGGSTPYVFDWNDDAYDGLDTLTGLSAGNYALIVTDLNGCQDNDSIILNDPPVLTLDCAALSPVSTPGAADGTAEITFGGGTAPYTITWTGPVNGNSTEASPGTLPLSGLPAGAYIVTLTDTNGCTETCNFAVNDSGCNLVLNATGTDPTCNGQPTGSIDLTVTGGTPPFSYDWNIDSLDGTADPTGLSGGDYNVIVTDNQGCSFPADVTLTEPPAISLTCGQTAPPSQPGASDGQVQIIAAGGTSPYNLLWSGPATGNTNLPGEDTLLIDDLPAGDYILQLIDDNGCQQTCQFTIVDPACNLSATLTGTDPACTGATDGALTLTVDGATEPVTYDWNVDSLDGLTDPSGLAAGLYTVLVTDGAGCTIDTSFTLTDPPALDLSCAQESPVSTVGGDDGVASVDLAGGTPPYSVNWSGATPGDTTGLPAGNLLITSLSTGTYNLTLVDANGCTQTCIFTIGDQICNLTLQIAGTDNTCPDAGDGAIDLTINNGTAPFTIDWDTDALDGVEDPTGLSPGDYNLLVSDAAGCTASASITIGNDFTQPTVTLSEGGTICTGECYSFDLAFTGAAPFLLYYQVTVGGTVQADSLPVSGPTGSLELCADDFGLNAGSLIVELLMVEDANCSQALDQTETIMVNSPTMGTLFTTLCPGESLLVNGNTYDEANPSGTEILPAAAANGCDSILNVQIEFFPTATGQLNATLCPGESLLVNGNTYDEANPSGTEILPAAAANGCDSILNVQIEFFPTATGQLNATLCPGESLLLNGNTYDEANPSGTEILPAAAANGCDSILNVQIEFFPTATGQLNATLCPGESLLVNGNTYDEANPSGTEILPAAAANGCDSILNVQIEFFPTATGQLNATLCPGESLLVNGNTYDETNPSGTEILPAAAANGCDSILNVQIEFFPTATGQLNATLCPGESLLVNGNTYDETNPSGTEILPAAAANGCDSILNVQIEFFPTATGQLNATLCPGESLLVNGNTYDEANPSGTEILPAAAANGCDSILNVQIEFFPTATGQLNATLCPGESLLVNGNTYDEANPSGTEILPAAAANGCDSILNVQIEFFPTATGQLNATLCPGESLLVNGNTYDEANPSGTEILPAAAANGCDSILNVQIEFFPTATGQLNATLCPGESLLVNGNTYDEANPSGTEILPAAAANGCDSILNVQIEFFPPVTTTLNPLLCPGDSIIVGGEVFDFFRPTGTIVLTSANGCDSTITIDLDFLDGISGFLEADSLICTGETAQLTFQLQGSSSYDLIYQAGNDTPESLEGIFDGYTIDVSPSESTTYAILAILASGTDCPSAIGDPVTVRVNDLAAQAVPTSDYGGYGVSCPESTDGSAAVTATNGQPPYNYQWSTGAGVDQLEMLATGTYQVTVTDSDGCTTVDSLLIDAPDPIVVEASGSSPICFGESNGQISIDTILGGVPPFEFSDDGEFFGLVSDLPLEIPGLPAGSYSIYIQDLNDCPVQTIVEVPATAQLQLNLGTDQTIQLGDSLTLSGFPNFDIDSVKWNPVEFLDNPTSNTTIARPLATTTYQLTAFDANGCAAEDRVTVMVETDRPVYIPSAFSPDGDETNDRLMIFGGSGIIEVETFQVFDRWGNLVHQANGFQPGDREAGWDGRRDGQPMNAGVYVYYALIRFVDGKTEVFRGDILLAR